MSEQIVQLDPSTILADDNTRFNLKPTRVSELAQSILDMSGVRTPIEVQELKPAQNGFKYRLTAGFYRHAAVTKLNTEQSAGLTLPAIVRNPETDLDRLKNQLTENMQRENMSPMDAAVAIKKLLDLNVSRPDIRRIFSRPTGKKGTIVQPASNSWLNISVRLLDLPKTIQEKIHDGRIGLEAAYELGKVPPDKRQAVVERAESERTRQLDIEEKDEEKYLKAEQKVVEAEVAQKTALSEVEATRAEVAAATETVTAKKMALKEAQNVPNFLELDEAAKKVATEHIKAATADVKAAEKLYKDSSNKLAKVITKAKSAEELAADQKAKLEMARKNKTAKSAKGRGKSSDSPLGTKEIKKAAQKEGVDTSNVPLSYAEAKDAIKDLIKQEGSKRVAAIGLAIKQCFDGKTTPKELTHDLAVIVGDIKALTAPPAKAPAAK